MSVLSKVSDVIIIISCDSKKLVAAGGFQPMSCRNLIIVGGARRVVHVEGNCRGVGM